MAVPGLATKQARDNPSWISDAARFRELAWLCLYKEYNMVRIDFCSDLHMEINANVQDHVSAEDDKGDILVLNGDISCYRFFSPHRTDNEARSMRKRFANFLSNQNHEHIIWIPGNHEYYGYQFDGAVDQINTLCKSFDPRLQALNNEVFIYQDVHLYCCTLWTDFHRNNPLVKGDVAQFMNDFRVIGKGKVPFSTEDAYTEHMASMDALKKSYENRGDSKFVVATHHGPSLQSHNIHRFGGSVIKYGYLSDYDDWIENTEILAWIHGHTHHNVDYKIGNTLITSAMYGYLGHDRTLSDGKMTFGRIVV